MHHHLAVSGAIANARDGRLEQRRELRPALRAVDIQLPQRPEHASGHFIAGLDHSGGRALPGELAQHISRVGVHRIRQGGQILTQPALRRVLLTRIGPEVGIMEVQQELQPGLLDALRHR